MPRIRSIHPAFWTDDATLELSATVPMAILFVVGLWGDADDQGVFEWKPHSLKARILPSASVDPVELLAALVRVDAVRAFDHEGRRYGAIRNFRKWQRPKTPNAVHPTPGDIRNYVGLEAAISGTDADERTPRPPFSEIDRDEREAFPPKAENPPQMEDGGGRMEDGQASPSLRSGAVLVAEPVHLLDEAFRLYAETAARHPAWVQHRELPKDLTKALMNRLKDLRGLEGWRLVLQRCERSSFLCGRAGTRPFKMKLDFLVSPSNLRKILDGNYDDAPGAAQTGANQPCSNLLDGLMAAGQRDRGDGGVPLEREGDCFNLPQEAVSFRG